MGRVVTCRYCGNCHPFIAWTLLAVVVIVAIAIGFKRIPIVSGNSQVLKTDNVFISYNLHQQPLIRITEL